MRGSTRKMRAIRGADGLLAALGALLMLLGGSALAEVTVNLDTDHSAFRVVLPKDPLATFAGPDGLQHSQALFGLPSYGGDKKITGELFYVTPADNVTGCDEGSFVLPKDIPKGTNKIFLVDRGSCDFVQKMRSAQKQGAVAVIISDNICQCKDYENWNDNPLTGRTPEQRKQCERLGERAQQDGRIAKGKYCENGLPYMADDGTGSDVVIPSFLISHLDAQPLKDCFLSANEQSGYYKSLAGPKFKCEKGAKVVVSLEWDLPRRDGLVDWELWSSSDTEGVFKKAFQPIAKKIQDQTVFRPRYFIWDGEAWGCANTGICGDQCTPGGYYCNPDPDHALFEGVSGNDVVEENLRELCIWDQAEERKNPGLWWDYVVEFAQQCHAKPLPDKKFYNLECSERVQDKVGLDKAATAKCVKGSWNTDGTNKKLKEEIEQRTGYKILTLPTAIVRNTPLRGGITPPNVLSAICGSFAADKVPALCTCVDRSSPSTLLDCVNSDCPAGQRMCSRDKKCYDPVQYAKYCSDICPDSSLLFCPSLASCIPQTQTCPQCQDQTKPFYCQITSSCVSGPGACAISAKGTSAFGVFVITLVVVSMAGCGAYAFWRRQRARLHDDVRAILSSYMALEESEDDTRFSRQTRQHTEPAIQPSSQPGSQGVAGQDAAQFI